MPHPQRRGQAGLRPVWLSPPKSETQLLAILELHRHTRSPAALRVLLWLAGYDVDPAVVRRSLTEVVERAHRDALRAVARVGAAAPEAASDDGLAAALAEASKRFAAIRGGQLLPRLPSARGHRQPAIRAILHVFLLGTPPENTLGSGLDVERALGTMPRAVHDRLTAATIGVDPGEGLPWHDGMPLDLGKLAEVASLPALARAAGQATDADLEKARQVTRPLLQGLRTFAAVTGRLESGNFLGLALWRSKSRDPNHLEELLTLALLLSMLQSDLRRNLELLAIAVHRFMQSVQDLDRVLRLPQHLVSSRMGRLSATQKKLLNALIRRPPSNNGGAQR
jgi:hypothetical protein